MHFPGRHCVCAACLLLRQKNPPLIPHINLLGAVYPDRGRKNVNPPYTPPVPLPPHFHENGFDSCCGLCWQLREQTRREHPQRIHGRACDWSECVRHRLSRARGGRE